MALSSVGGNARSNLAVSSRRSNVLALELGQEASVCLAEGTGVAESVHLAGTAEVGRAGLVGASAGRSEDLTLDGALSHGRDVLEDVALGEDVGAGANLEGVAGVVVPVVVDLVVC